MEMINTPLLIILNYIWYYRWKNLLPAMRALRTLLGQPFLNVKKIIIIIKFYILMHNNNIINNDITLTQSKSKLSFVNSFLISNSSFESIL